MTAPDPSLSRRVMDREAGGTRRRRGIDRWPRDRADVLRRRRQRYDAPLPQGRTNAEIAADLHISLSTAKTHLASLMRELNARNRVEIAMWAYETQRIPAEPLGSAERTEEPSWFWWRVLEPPENGRWRTWVWKLDAA